MSYTDQDFETTEPPLTIDQALAGLRYVAAAQYDAYQEEVLAWREAFAAYEVALMAARPE